MNLGNVPCSWSVEFADDPRDPPWRAVLDECAFARFAGIELATDPDRFDCLRADKSAWCTVEWDYAPDATISKVEMARANREHLASVGF